MIRIKSRKIVIILPDCPYGLQGCCSRDEALIYVGFQRKVKLLRETSTLSL